MYGPAYPPLRRDIGAFCFENTDFGMRVKRVGIVTGCLSLATTIPVYPCSSAANIDGAS